MASPDFALSIWISAHLEGIGAAVLVGVAGWQVAKKRAAEKKNVKKLQHARAEKLDEPLTLHPEVNPALCMGCGACTRVCPEGDILSLVDHKAVLVSPTKCVGHGECEQACPSS